MDACSAGICDDLTSGALLLHYRLSRLSCYMFLLLPFLPRYVFGLFALCLLTLGFLLPSWSVEKTKINFKLAVGRRQAEITSLSGVSLGGGEMGAVGAAKVWYFLWAISKLLFGRSWDNILSI